MVVFPVHNVFNEPQVHLQESHVPAWKRLGLKLKNVKDTEDVINSTNRNSRGKLKRASPDTHLALAAEETFTEQPAKRRHLRFEADKFSQSNGKLAKPSDNFPKDRNTRQRKKVSFTAETKLEDGGKELIANWEQDDYAYYEQKAAENDAKEAQRKSEKLSFSSEKLSGTPRRSKDALDYLNLYRNSRSSWKFNKNREVWILRHILSTDKIPASFNGALASYVHGLGSNQARSRLLNQCREALEKDVPKDPSGDEKDSDLNDMEDPTRRKAYHDAAVRRFKRSLEDHLDELQRKADEDDPEYQRWLSRRRRAELLYWAVTPSTSSTERVPINRHEARSNPYTSISVESVNGVTANAVTGNKVLPSGHPLKRKKKKNRTAVVEASSSSEEQSGSSADEGDGSEVANGNDVRKDKTESSSSTDQSSSAASSDDGDSDTGAELATCASHLTNPVCSSEDEQGTNRHHASGKRQQSAISISSGSNASIILISSTSDETSSSASSQTDDEQDDSEFASSTVAADTLPSINSDRERTGNSDGEAEDQSDSD